MDKRGIEFNFAVLFSIIVGAMIIFLAIYSASKIIHTGSSESQSSLTKQLTIIFDPMETGIASGKYKPFSFSENSRVYNECFPEGDFGSQRFSFSIQSFNKWQEKNLGQKVSNKYVFSDKIEEGKKAYIFSKPLNMPFKVSELIFFTTKTYCFFNAPDFIKDEVESMSIQNIKIENCSSSDVKVCFGGTGTKCNVTVIASDTGDYEYGKIKRDNKEIYYYSSALMYAGIFSNPEIYECNVKRLMKRISAQAILYGDESYFINNKCGAVAKEELAGLSSSASSLTSSSGLQAVANVAKDVNEKNIAASCELW